MAAVQQRQPSGRPSTSHSSIGFNQRGGNLTPLPPGMSVLPTASGSQNPQLVYQHIHETATKRIASLNYLRRAHEGGIHWLNSLQYGNSDLAKLPSFDARKLSRRAANYLILGFSLPAVLDFNSHTPTDYLRALNDLLHEFESYQSIHSFDASGATSLGRARIPQMFKRGPQGKGRRSSAATDFLFSLGDHHSADQKAAPTSGSGGVASASVTNSHHSAIDQELLPGEEYTHLLTPSLPFDPDYLLTFSSLCEMLIDCYTKVVALLPSAESCVAGVAELFARADARLKKIIISNPVKEFEENSRGSIKSEVAGIGKLVFGGLM